MKRFLCIFVLLWNCNLDDSGITEPVIKKDLEMVCNNVIRESGEQCDTDVPDAKSCENVGFGGGVAFCNAQCEIDYSNCSMTVLCGNGILDDTEECETGNLNGTTCQTKGFDQGVVECTKDCIVDDSSCVTHCGNNIIGNGEKCDGIAFGDTTCRTEKGQGWNGELSCRSDCKTIDTSTCFEVKPQIVAAREFNCRLNYEGRVDCWNKEDILPNSGTYVKISTGSFHVCGLKNDGTVECWGENSEGQNDVPPMLFQDVIADGRYSCGLAMDGTIQCWGESTLGQTTPPRGSGYRSLAGGKEHACAIDFDGAIQCWGTWKGAPEFRIYEVLLNQEYSAASTGRYYDCGLEESGQAECWSENPDQSGRKQGPFTKLSTNTFHTCGLRNDGDIECWGIPQFGKTDSHPGPFIDVSTGYYHTCGMKPDLSVECWGINALNIDETTELFFKGQTATRPPP